MALCPLLNVGVSVQVFERCVPIATVFVMYLLFLFCLLRQGLRALGFVPAVERRRLLRWLRLVVMYVLVFLCLLRQGPGALGFLSRSRTSAPSLGPAFDLHVS